MMKVSVRVRSKVSADQGIFVTRLWRGFNKAWLSHLCVRNHLCPYWRALLFSGFG